MASWMSIHNEMVEAGKSRGIPGPDTDKIRRAFYTDFTKISGRPLLIYASAFLTPFKNQLGQLLSIDLSDKDGFQEIIGDISGPNVDIFIHSPGGSAEAVESIVSILRSRFDHIRFIITGTAKSAATMLAMSGDEILMADAAELGPTDPQIFCGNPRPSPAGSIIDQFEQAKTEISKNPANIAPWIPILQQFGPSLLMECHNHIKLSQTLVAGWLERYMFNGEDFAQQKASKLANYLANDKNFYSHGRRVDRDCLISQGARIIRIEDQTLEFQEAIRKIHSAIMLTFDLTIAIKIFENSNGTALIRMGQIVPNRPPP